jgi:RNA polymerase sigma factor (sigma-70 family)
MGLSYSQLKSGDLAQLIEAAQSDVRDDSPAMHEIILRFEGKIRRIAAAVCHRAADRDDVANVCRLALLRAVRRHDVTRQGFATYAIAFMTGAARRESMRLAYPAETCFDTAELADAIDNPARVETADGMTVDVIWGTGRLGTVIIELPTPQQRLLHERYVQDLDLMRIAQMHGSSVSAVSQRLGTVHSRILRMMQPIVATAVAA